MGSLFRPPSPAAAPVAVAAAPPPVAPAVQPAVDAEDAERRKRLEAIARRQRGLASTITTSSRGLLVLNETLPQRKSLLGE